MSQQTPMSPAAVPAGRAAHIAGLDGLRAIAVVAVIAYHLTPGAVAGGFVGVDVFFVISGFLITTLLLRERARTGSIRLGAFWVRRARRLLPALGLLVLGCGTAAWLIGGDALVGLGRHILGAVTFSSNWLSIGSESSYFSASTPELFKNLWSLAVEEQFYLIWPLAILLLLHLPARWMRAGVVGVLAIASAVGMGILATASLEAGGDPTRAYFGTDTHSFGLAIGAALALALGGRQITARWASRLLNVVGLLAVLGILAASLLLDDTAPITYTVGLPAVALLTGLAIMGAGGEESWLGRALDVAPLRWLGERSYGLYLWHWPVSVLLLTALPELSRTTAGLWAIGGIALVITVASATLSYRFIEMPVRTLGFRGALRAASRAAFPSPLAGAEEGIGHRRLRAFTGIAATLVLVTCVAATGAGISADPGRGTVQAQIEAGERAINESAAADTPSGDSPGTSAESESSEPPALPGGEQITAIGDSVMLASAPALQRAFPGIEIDATVSRQFSTAPELLRARLDAGTLRPTVLLGLGTNGPISEDALAEVRQILGKDHQLVLVNVYAPRSWTDGVNVELASYAQRFRAVELANWRDAISPRLQLLARDQIHPGDAGGEIYAAAVRDALQRLAELPPVLGPREFGLAAQPL